MLPSASFTDAVSLPHPDVFELLLCVGAGIRSDCTIFLMSVHVAVGAGPSSPCYGHLDLTDFLVSAAKTT